MELIHFIEQLLYEVSTALYLPVIGGCVRIPMKTATNSNRM